MNLFQSFCRHLFNMRIYIQQDSAEKWHCRRCSSVVVFRRFPVVTDNFQQTVDLCSTPGTFFWSVSGSFACQYMFCRQVFHAETEFCLQIIFRKKGWCFWASTWHRGCVARTTRPDVYLISVFSTSTDTTHKFMNSPAHILNYVTDPQLLFEAAELFFFLLLSSEQASHHHQRTNKLMTIYLNL